MVQLVLSMHEHFVYRVLFQGFTLLCYEYLLYMLP